MNILKHAGNSNTESSKVNSHCLSVESSVNDLKKYFIKLTLAYDGTNYCGWQIQKNGYSIHQALMESGQNFLRDAFTITGSSRTDAGVHALSYVALLVTTTEMDIRKVSKAFNAHLPEDIVVHGAEMVSEDFHPRYLAKSKHYRYTIYNHPFALPQYTRFAYYLSKELNVEKMNEAAKAFIGTHDFKGFCSIKTTVENTVRTIYECTVTKEKEFIYIDIRGDGFLYNMVRIITGSLIEVGLNRIPPEQMKDILASKDRDKARKTAPAKGLTLVELCYS
jgi:tRNA pseudouridine38-40 synthase